MNGEEACVLDPSLVPVRLIQESRLQPLDGSSWRHLPGSLGPEITVRPPNSWYPIACLRGQHALLAY